MPGEAATAGSWPGASFPVCPGRLPDATAMVGSSSGISPRSWVAGAIGTASDDGGAALPLGTEVIAGPARPGGTDGLRAHPPCGIGMSPCGWPCGITPCGTSPCG